MTSFKEVLLAGNLNETSTSSVRVILTTPPSRGLGQNGFQSVALDSGNQGTVCGLNLSLDRPEVPLAGLDRTSSGEEAFQEAGSKNSIDL